MLVRVTGPGNPRILASSQRRQERASLLIMCRALGDAQSLHPRALGAAVLVSLFALLSINHLQASGKLAPRKPDYRLRHAPHCSIRHQVRPFWMGETPSKAPPSNDRSSTPDAEGMLCVLRVSDPEHFFDPCECLAIPLVTSAVRAALAAFTHQGARSCTLPR